LNLRFETRAATRSAGSHASQVKEHSASGRHRSLSRQPGKTSRGFTTMELLVVVGVLGLILAASLPSFRSMYSGYRHKSAATRMTGHMTLTRQMAVRDATPYVFVLDPPNSRYSMFQDTDRDGVPDAGERAFGPYATDADIRLINVSIAGNRVTFLTNGAASQGGDVRIIDAHNHDKTIRLSAITGNAEILP
jgi:Tfp pilus assembly protein FimT